VVRELGDRARFAPADVTDEKAVTAALDIAESLGPLRIVINCAGTGNAIKTLERMALSHWRHSARSWRST